MSNAENDRRSGVRGDADYGAPDEVLHEVIQPQGYVGVGGVNCHPFWDSEGRVIVLRCHADGSVTWQLRGDGKVLEPEVPDA